MKILGVDFTPLEVIFLSEKKPFFHTSLRSKYIQSFFEIGIFLVNFNRGGIMTDEDFPSISWDNTFKKDNRSFVVTFLYKKY